MKELLTEYGDLCLIWFDNPYVITKGQSQELVDMIKKYQPNCLINSRVGNGVEDYHSMGDNVLPEEDFGDKLVECPATLNDSWGYKSFDENWKNADKVKEIKEYLNSRGVNYLLNVGPDGLGRIPSPSIEILKKVGEK